MIPPFINDGLFEKIIIVDIRHQDIYEVYRDKHGLHYDEHGKLIDIENYINYNTSYYELHNEPK
jgi:hypothetical protein